MRIGMAGLNGLYWPVAIANGLQGKAGVEFISAATLGESWNLIEQSLGISPTAYADRYGLQLYVSAEEMIHKERLDTIVLVCRHSQHAKWVERLAPLGVDIFLPKTFATTLEDADRIVAAAAREQIRIAVGPSARFLPPMATIYRAIQQDVIGKPFSLRVCHHHGTIDVFHQNDWYRDVGEGGPELSLGWYGIDLIGHLMGDTIQSVYAHYGNFTSPGSPFMDCGRIECGLTHGGMASFDMYFCNRFEYPSWQLEMLGPKGVISLHRMESASSRTIITVDTSSEHRELPIEDSGIHWEMFWVDEFMQGQPISIPAEYARYVTEVTLAARLSAETGKCVELRK